MAKPQSGKAPHRPDHAMEANKTEPVAIADEDTNKVQVIAPVVSPPKKEVTPNRPKKQAASATKSTSLLPSAHKLEHLKAAVAAAGNAEKLLLILHHVEEAGGKSEVSESIEAYRVLKTVLEE